MGMTLAGCNDFLDYTPTAVVDEDKAFSDPVTPRARQILLDAARRLVEVKHVDAILLGCTEIPVAVTESCLWDTPVVDATSVLARELIRASCPERLKESLDSSPEKETS